MYLKKKDLNKRVFDLLEEKEFFTQATIIGWQIIRSSLFHFLNSKKINYASTREAIAKFILLDVDNQICENICFLDSCATLAEWDDYLIIDKVSFQVIKNKIIESLNFFQSGR